MATKKPLDTTGGSKKREPINGYMPRKAGGSRKKARREDRVGKVEPGDGSWGSKTVKAEVQGKGDASPFPK